MKSTVYQNRFKLKAGGTLLSWDLDDEIIDLGNGVKLTLRDLFLGTMVFGSPGSGKTSGVLNSYARAFLRHGFGGLFLSFKKEDPENWIRLCKEEGRSRDLIIISSEENNCFNFLEHEISDTRAGVRDTAHLFRYLGQGEKGRGGDNQNPFWDEQLERFLMFSLNLLVLSQTKISATNIKKIHNSLPKGKETRADEKSKYYRELLDIIDRRISQKEFDGFSLIEAENTKTYFLESLVSYSPETKGNVHSVIDSFMDLFVNDPLRRLLMDGSTTNPTEAFKGKIFVIDMPAQEIGTTARILNTVWKHCFQMAISRRDFKPGDRPVFCITDENHCFITPGDVEAQATLRSKGYISVSACQALSYYRSALGSGSKASDLLNALLGVSEAKVFCKNNDLDTNDYAIKLMGKIKRSKKIDLESLFIGSVDIFKNMFFDSPSDSFRKDKSGSKDKKKEESKSLDQMDLATLKYGTAKNRCLVEAFVYMPGKFGKCLGSKLTFSQDGSLEKGVFRPIK